MAQHELPSFLKPTLRVSQFTVAIPDNDIADFKTLLRLSKLPPATATSDDRHYGITASWMSEAKQKWQDFDWKATESKLNSLPQFTTEIDDFTVHFVATFSEDPDAVPLVLLHGWPGCYYEFYPLITALRKDKQKNYHIIVPSLPGYAFSTAPTDRQLLLSEMASVVDRLVVGLGFPGYVAVGGDIGSLVARGLSGKPACRGVHLNMYVLLSEPPTAVSSLPRVDQECVARGEMHKEDGTAYALIHGTRPNTISHVLASSPLAILAWIAEKFLDWTEEDPSMELILEVATLYWFTESFPRGIHPYREYHNIRTTKTDWTDTITIRSPYGYSWFPKEIIQKPLEWIEHDNKDVPLAVLKRHDRCGHFPAFECPYIYAEDIHAFVEALVMMEKKM